MSTAKVLNVDSLLKKFDNLSQASVEKAIGKACILVENSAKEKCPVDTGDLRRSIHSSVHTEGTKVIGEIGTPLKYSVYVEYGTGLFAEAGNGRKDVPWHYQTADGKWHSTVGQHPQPYMRPALTDNEEKIKSVIINELKQEVKTNV